MKLTQLGRADEFVCGEDEKRNRIEKNRKQCKIYMEPCEGVKHMCT